MISTNIFAHTKIDIFSSSTEIDIAVRCPYCGKKLAVVKTIKRAGIIFKCDRCGRKSEI